MIMIASEATESFQQDGETEDRPLVLEGDKSEDWANFLSIIYHE